MTKLFRNAALLLAGLLSRSLMVSCGGDTEEEEVVLAYSHNKWSFI